MTATRTDRPLHPPAARREPRRTAIHGTELVDPYAWLRRRDDPDVRAYLEAENAYAEHALRHTEPLRETLYRELRARVPEEDRSVPARIDDYHYYTRISAGQQYRVHCRRRAADADAAAAADAAEEVLLDLDALAAGKRFFALGVFEVSPDHRYLAYSTNDDGSERFTLRVLDLERGEPVGEPIDNTAPSFAWANDSRTFFYALLDPLRRPYRALRHRVGAPVASAELVYEETDERFFLSIARTRSRRFVILKLGSNVTTELRLIDADRPDAEPLLLAERRQGVELDVAHRGDDLYLLTNREALNFKLLRVPLAAIGDPARWREVLPHDPDVQLDAVEGFRDHLVVELRRGGLRGLLIRDLRDGAQHEVAFDEPVYTVAVDENPTFDTGVLRFAYSSLVTPRSIYDYDMTTRRRELRKRTPVPGGYDAERYRSERLYARSSDGTEVPISIVYDRRRGNRRRPTLLYGYGAYGTSIEPRFVASRLSLLERGFVYAIAHVRGGGELGRGWYEDGKLLRKPNTFRDFIAAAEHLVATGVTTPDRLAIRGGSAGGLLIGAVLNRRPELCAAAVAEVPFVDALNTMLDPSLPLTVVEFEEWGNPRERLYFDCIRAYSPYENVAPARYPHLLVTAGLNDPRVQYWEPAKWIAKLRDHHRGDGRLLLKVDLRSGHTGASGRYDALREEAFKLAFILDSLGVEA